ncbi:hypothetical protein BaRGS_00004230 [Batillaria attramentaria]|uniref:Uncharacterized protein n=1 Tax=Batillaria attramentaria TaxID=370345 RepID=A0ABD0LXJ4_9CAEN
MQERFKEVLEIKCPTKRKKKKTAEFGELEFLGRHKHKSAAFRRAEISLMRQQQKTETRARALQTAAGRRGCWKKRCPAGREAIEDGMSQP